MNNIPKLEIYSSLFMPVRKGIIVEMKKKVLIIVGIIIVLIIAIIAYMIISDKKQEQKLIEEFKYIDSLVAKEENETFEIKASLERTVTTKGDYLKTEKAYKQYLKDVYQNMETMTKILEDERISNSLTVENYKEDGPEFIETKKYLAETKQNLEDGKKKFYKLLTENEAMKYIKDQDVDSYYQELYKNEIKGYINLEEEQGDTVKEAINSVIDVLTASEKVINFLTENKDVWVIEDDSIVFDTQEVSDEYDKLLLEI